MVRVSQTKYHERAPNYVIEKFRSVFHCLKARLRLVWIQNFQIVPLPHTHFRCCWRDSYFTSCLSSPPYVSMVTFCTVVSLIIWLSICALFSHITQYAEKRTRSRKLCIVFFPSFMLLLRAGGLLGCQLGLVLFFQQLPGISRHCWHHVGSSRNRALKKSRFFDFLHG